MIEESKTGLKVTQPATASAETLSEPNVVSEDKSLTRNLSSSPSINNPSEHQVAVVSPDQKLSGELLEEAKEASEADLDAQFILAYQYEMGEGVNIDLTQAVRLYESAAAQKHPIAMYRLGVCLHNGSGITKDEERAQRLFREAISGLQTLATEGNLYAQTEVGRCYEEGWVVNEDETQAIMWYQRAAEQGFANAQFNLGVCYENGIGVAKDATQAVMWYRRAADQGNTNAQSNLGGCYYNGTGVPKDEAQAVVWYQRAAEQGHAVAQHNLGVCYQNGIGVPKDEAQAVVWCRRAAEQGNANAQSNLGMCFQDGTGVAKDEAQALMWYQRAAERGYANAQFNLGLCYKNGTGVTKDEAQAVVWYRRAADQGHASAQINLGGCYQNGTGVPKDEAQAVMWYQRAAEQGDAVAQYNLGVCYENGIGVTKDDAQAVMWYQRAAEQGHADAQSNLGVCYENSIGRTKDEAQAVMWYQRAADQGNANAQYNLGLYYQYRKGVTKDKVHFVPHKPVLIPGIRCLAATRIELGQPLGKGAFGEVYQVTYHRRWVTQDEVQAAIWYQRAAEQGHSNARLYLNRLLSLKPALLHYITNRTIEENPLFYRSGVDLFMARKAVLGTTVNLSEAQQNEAFEWEVRRLASVQHPNIVRMYGYHQEGTQLYLDMEYCAGGTLEKLLEKERLSLARCWQIALDLAQGLAYLKQRGIVHRDLKPDNILLDEEGRAKLADLGIAQVDALVQATDAKSVTGRKVKDWAAPEEIAKAVSGSASDCYSLGLIVWHMMTGRNPLGLPNFLMSVKTWAALELRLATLKEAIQSERAKRTPEEMPLYHLICTGLLAEDDSSRMTAEDLVAHLKRLARLHPQGLYLKMRHVTGLLVEEQREALLDYIPLQVTASPLQEDADHYWECREKESQSSSADLSQAPEAKREKKSGAADTTTLKALERNAPQALEANFDRFLADPSVSVLVLFGESGLGKSLSTYQLAQRLIKARQTNPTTQSESKAKASLAPQAESHDAPPAPESHYDLPPPESHYDASAPEPNHFALDGSAPAPGPASTLLFHKASTLEETLTTSDWLPIFIRPGIAQWAHSQLTQGLSICLKKYYHLSDQTIANLREARLLFILDGYDELQMDIPSPKTDIDIPPPNLPEQLGLADFPNAKLIVTSRHSAIKPGEEVARFGLAGRFTPYYLLPLPLDYLLAALEERLGWEPQQKEECAKRLEESTTLRIALRNPFVLNLFVQSWDTLSQENFNTLTRVGIYEGFIRHWLTTQADSLAEPVKQLLQGPSPDLMTRFYLTAGSLAFDAYRQSTLLLKSDSYVNEEAYPWLHLTTLVDRAAQAEFTKREQSTENRNRALLKEEDYRSLMQAKCAHFMLFSPLQQRARQHWNFVHKSFYDYFVARFLLHLSNGEDFTNLAAALSSRNIQDEPGIIQFIVEILTETQSRDQAAYSALRQKCFEIVLHSAKDKTLPQASSNAATLLNACSENLSYQSWAGVQLPGADLSYSVLAHSDLRGANLRGANLTHCMLYRVNLEGADLREVQWGESPHSQMKESVTAIAHHPRQPWIAIAQGNTIILKERDTDTLIGQAMVGHLSTVTSVAFSPDGSTVMSGGNFDPIVRLWDTQTQKPLGHMVGHTHGVRSVAFSPDGRRVVSGSLDNTVRLWDAKTQEPIGQPMVGHTKYVRSVAFSPYNRSVVSGSEDGTVRLWDTHTQKAIGQPMVEDSYPITSVAFSPDSRMVVSGSFNKTVRLWDTQTQKPIGQPMGGHTDRVWSVAFSPGGLHVISGGGDNTVRLWDIQTQRPLGQPMAGHTGFVSSVIFSPDGVKVVSGGADQTVRLWNIQLQKPLWQSMMRHSNIGVAFSPDGLYVVSGGADNALHLWDTRTQKPLGQPMEEHTDKVNSVIFSPDGLYVVSGSSDKTLRLWNTQTQKPFGQPMVGHADFVNSVAFSSDGDKVVSGGVDQTVRLWDTQTQKPLGQPMVGHVSSVNSVAFSPDGLQVVSGSLDKTLRLWDIQTQKPFGQPMVGHADFVNSVAFSSDGAKVVSGGVDQTVRLWDTQTQKPFGQPMMGHAGFVNSVVFSPDDTKVVSGSGDKTVRLWDVNPILGAKQDEGIILLTWHQTIERLSFAPRLLQKTMSALSSEEKLSDAFSEHSNGRLVSEGEDMLVMSDGAGTISFWAVSYGPNPHARFLGMPKHISMPLLPLNVQFTGCQMSTLSRRLLEQYGADVSQVTVIEDTTASVSLTATFESKALYVEDRNPPEALKETQIVKMYRDLAEQGIASAQYNLGVCYRDGIGVAKDEAQAVVWYRRAAEQGFANAQYNLGVCYQNGIGVPKDEAQAVMWYRRAAEQGFANAHYSLAICYRNGIGVAKDEAQAVMWYHRAAEQGYANAQYNLGVCYHNGTGIAKDEAEAVVWYQQAAEQGHAKAQYNLGVYYEDGRGVAKDEAQAVVWYQRAAEQGFANAQNSLGWCYEDGVGVAKHEAQAVVWYRRAAEQGFANAQYNLGVCYQAGIGVAKDETQAVVWYQRAAEQGFADAQSALAMCYANGTGVTKEEAQAVVWYRRAAEQGDVNAQNNIAALCLARGNVDEAIQLYESALLKLGGSVALHSLACAYHVRSHQKHNEDDWLQAQKMFEKAAQFSCTASVYSEYAQFLYIKGLEQSEKNWFEESITPLIGALDAEEEGGLSYSWTERETVLPCLRSLLTTSEDNFEISPRLLARYLLVSCYCHLNQLQEASVAFGELEKTASTQATVISERLLAAAKTEYATCQEQIQGREKIPEEKSIASDTTTNSSSPKANNSSYASSSPNAVAVAANTDFSSTTTGPVTSAMSAMVSTNFSTSSTIPFSETKAVAPRKGSKVPPPPPPLPPSHAASAAGRVTFLNFASSGSGSSSAAPQSSHSLSAALKVFDLEIKEETEINDSIIFSTFAAYKQRWVDALLQERQPDRTDTEAYERLRQLNKKFRLLPTFQSVREEAEHTIMALSEKILQEARGREQQLAQSAAAKYNLTLQDVPDKGNCFFDSVSDQLQQRYGIVISADRLRIIAMEQMRRDPNRYVDRLSTGQDFSFKHIESAALNDIKSGIGLNELNEARSTLKVAALVNQIDIVGDISSWSMDQMFGYCIQNPNKATTAFLSEALFPLLTPAQKVSAHIKAMLENVERVEAKAESKEATNGYRRWADDIDILALSDALGISIISVQPIVQNSSRLAVSSSSSTSSLTSSASTLSSAATPQATTLHYYDQHNASPPLTVAFTGKNHYQSLRGDSTAVLVEANMAQGKRPGSILPPLKVNQLEELATKPFTEVAAHFNALRTQTASINTPLQADSSSHTVSSPNVTAASSPPPKLTSNTRATSVGSVAKLINFFSHMSSPVSHTTTSTSHSSLTEPTRESKATTSALTAKQKTDVEEAQAQLKAVENLLSKVYPDEAAEHANERAKWLAKLLPYQQRSEVLTAADQQALIQLEQGLETIQASVRHANRRSGLFHSQGSE